MRNFEKISLGEFLEILPNTIGEPINNQTIHTMFQGELINLANRLIFCLN